MNNPVLVTGGAGFIGSNFVLHWLKSHQSPIINLDKLTYAGNLQNLCSVMDDKHHVFVKGDINDQRVVNELFTKYKPRGVVHFAAESHVDRSILGPEEFIRTNVNGTFCLLETARAFWSGLDDRAKSDFRFLHVSTDEVYGSLGPQDEPFAESRAYEPNSPYSASKAASDHLVRAYFRTYGLPAIITNCSNNYGPYQFPEKLIPLVLLNACEGKALPVYGDGMNVRDWLYVEDHCEALQAVLENGRPGETYNVGANNERANIEVVKAICNILDELRPGKSPRESLITYVTDRPGHDRRYAIDSRKIKRELGWSPKETFETGLRKTVEWYLSNGEWVTAVRTGKYRQWIEVQYGRS